MSDAVIKVENIGKKYIIGHQKQERYTALRDVISEGFKSFGRKLLSPMSKVIENQDEFEEFWALKDVSFEVKQGDRVGIIGRNGAGKSTLLKILSRITEPTEGRVSIKGRVASLLEVGTGFHPELTGRENIFLNGAILGMSRVEIKKKFDEIVDFAEVEKFLDTPVKRYSSGMYVRLAFAVAAHLEPEILIVDEVLAVGDAQFQKKCLGKMEDVAQNEGRTVLFVSHNMAAIQSLCSRGVLLNKGIIAFSGQSDETISFYLRSFSNDKIQDISQRQDRQGNGTIKITQIDVKDKLDNKNVPFPVGSELLFIITYISQTDIKNPRIILGIYDEMNVGFARFDTDLTTGLSDSIKAEGTVYCSTERINLKPGRYYINIAFFRNNIIEDYVSQASFFEIIDSDYFETGRVFLGTDKSLFQVLYKHQWSVQ